MKDYITPAERLGTQYDLTYWFWLAVLVSIIFAILWEASNV